MIEKLEEIKARFEEVGQLIVQPDVVNDRKKFTGLSKEYGNLEKVVRKYDEYRGALSTEAHAREILETEKDPELRELAKMELDDIAPKIAGLEQEIKDLLTPRDPDDDKNLVLEVRAGTGGDEASIFAGDLFRMYQRYCERKGVKVSVVDFTEIGRAHV